MAHLPLSRVAGWLARPPPAVRYGVKLGTVVAAAIWIADVTNLSWGLTIWITVMLVAQPNQGASIVKGVTRICGSVAAALVSIAIYGLFAQQPPLYLASIVGVIAVATYGMLGTRHQYAWMVFGLTTIIIVVKAMAGSDQIETLAFERASLTAFGVLIVVVADLVFWPVRAEAELRQGLAERSRQLGDALTRPLDALLPTPKPPSSPLVAQLGLAAQARDEVGVSPARVRTLTRIALLLEGLASRARLLEREASPQAGVPPRAPDPPLRAALERLGQGLEAALAEASRALAADRAPESFGDQLDRSLARFESEPSALAPVLRDVVTLLRKLEQALVGLANEDRESKTRKASQAAPASVVEWFRLDPIRVQLALRAGIAAGGVIVLMLAMGWHSEEDILAFIFAPIVAFIFAGVLSTRGAGTVIGIGWALGVLLGWLIADLAGVFLFTHLDRMPLSLVYPLAIAGGAGYLIVRGSPLGVFGALFGMITAILPIFVGDGPPEDVDAAYGLVCGVLLGLATGRVAQLFLWPRTAMQTFRERAAGQLDLCARAVQAGERGSHGAAWDRDAAQLPGAYAKQLTLLGQLHAQAHVEPVEDSLDDPRRAELLSLTQDLFDAALGGHRGASPAGVPDALREALQRENEALLDSVQATANALRGEAPGPDSSLAEARHAVRALLNDLAARRQAARRSRTPVEEDFLVQLDSRRLLVTRQLAIEAWLTDWNRAAAVRA